MLPAPPGGLDEGFEGFAFAQLSPTRLVICGGCQQGWHGVNTCSSLNLEIKQWEALPPLQQARYGCKATVCNDGSLLVIGGFNGQEMASVERLSPGPGQSFAPAADLRNRRSYHGMCTLKDGRVFVCGGGGALRSAELYDPTTNRWTGLPDMSTDRSDCMACSLLNKEGKEFVLVFGGYCSSACEAYDVALGRWSQLPDMPDERDNASLFVLSESKVLLVGGLGDHECLPTALLFVFHAPQERMWRRVPAMDLPFGLVCYGSSKVTTTDF